MASVPAARGANPARPPFRFAAALFIAGAVCLSMPAFATEHRWTADVGGAAGWDSDVGDELEPQGHSAPHGSVWAFGGRSLILGDAHRLHLGAGYAGRFMAGHAHLTSHGLVAEVALLWLPDEGWVLRLAPWASVRTYGDRNRDSVLGGLAGVARYQAAPRMVVRLFARVAGREAALADYSTRSAGLGGGVEVDLSQRVWIGAGYGLEGARWTAVGATGPAPIQPGPIGSHGLPSGGAGGAHLLAHTLSASLNLDLDGFYTFASYGLTWLAPTGGTGWAVHAVTLGAGLRR